ncbi:MAG: HugZ family protein [Candidatus Rokuibacteriota bacterium]
MSRHGHTTGAPGPTAPEPTFAEQARTLAHLGRTGTLGTLSRRHPGHPFVSVMPYAPDERGRPLLLISTLAMHTQNLETDPRASLLVAQAGAGEDPLALARVTLMGRAQRLAAAERAAARGAYLARHPNAAHWVDFEDFAFWRLDLTGVYFVGGFGAMDWLEVHGYETAHPDPLADAAAGIIEHMNRDHADALVLYARVLGGLPAEAAEMVAVDRLGFKLRVRAADGLHGRRIGFPREIAGVEECRAVLIEMIADLRTRRG